MRFQDCWEAYNKIETTHKDYNCCAVITFQKLFDTTYEEASELFKKCGRKTGHGITERILEDVFDSVKKSAIKKGPYTRANRVTLKKFTELHSQGRYFVLVSGHALAVIDGVVYDHKVGARRQVIGAWRIYPDYYAPTVAVTT